MDDSKSDIDPVDARQFSDFFVGMALRAGQSTYSDPPSQEKQYSIKRETVQEFPDKFRIATVTFEQPEIHRESRTHRIIGAAKKLNRIDRELFPRHRIVNYRDTRQFRNLDAALLERIDEFLEDIDDCHLLLLPELSTSFERKRRRELLRNLKNIAVKRETYIVAGTYHCNEENFSVAEIYPPFSSRNFDRVFKLNSAVKQGEYIRTPDARKIKILRTNFLNLAVCICLDFYDPGIIFKLVYNSVNKVRMNPSTEETEYVNAELILVPSYNKEGFDALTSAAKSVSRFSNSIVLVANAYNVIDQKKSEKVENSNYSMCFMCGEYMPPERDASRVYAFRNNDAYFKFLTYEIDRPTFEATVKGPNPLLQTSSLFRKAFSRSRKGVMPKKSGRL